MSFWHSAGATVGLASGMTFDNADRTLDMDADDMTTKATTAKQVRAEYSN